MSDRPIQVGDLVQVIHSCCGVFLGTIATVTGFRVPANSPCKDCGKLSSGIIRAEFDRTDWPLCAPISWLKRIPPLEELESNDMCHPMKEPA